MKEKFYITTPIYYPSTKLTIGNCYTTIICDAIARFKKLEGRDVFYMTGTDEHGQKIFEAAQKAGKDVKTHLDDIVSDTKELWKLLDIEYDKFIRTTDSDHVSAVKKIFNKLYEKGYIYKSTYKGLYCLPCESFWTESQLIDGKCPDCGRPVTEQEEEAYFFKLSEFSDKLLKLYSENPKFLLPTSRVNEMVNNFIKPGLEDLCVTRTSVKWGIPVDFDPKHTIYVWIDALSNYLTGLGYLSDDESKFKKYWPADLHVIGKDIVRFHSIIWPAMLMALDLPLPKQIIGHGWLLLGGDKLSKSKKTATVECVDPRILVPRYSADAVRYYLLREIPFGSDGQYSTEAFLNKFNSDLCNNFGNLVSRTFSMLKKYTASQIPDAQNDAEDEPLKTEIAEETKKVFKFMQDFDVSKALASIFNIFSKANAYIEKTEPFRLAKDPEKQARLQTVMRNLLECIRIGATLLYPFLPTSASKVLDALNIKAPYSFEDVEKFYALKSGTVQPLAILFPRLDIQKELDELAKI